MKKNIIKLAIITSISLLSVSCLNDLETDPKYEITLENLLIKDPNAIEGLLSKMYSNFALSSTKGPGDSDIDGANAGESPFIRGLINLNDFTADDMKNRWGDGGLDPLTTSSGWTDANKFFKYVYDRIYYIIPQTTNLIKIVNSDNVNVANKEQVTSELRFLRALAYYYQIDFFGKGALVTTENYGTTTPLPESSRKELFNYVESELLDIESKLPDTNGYGRANKSVARMLLAKLYLNAEVYTGSARYTDCAVYLNKIFGAGYQLETNFHKNFRADNNTSKEIIFPLIADSNVSQSYGNTTYIINGSLSTATMVLSDYSAAEGWTGHRATKAWYGLFATNAAALQASTDVRAKDFWTTGHNWEMNDYKEWTDGYPSIKYSNKATDGSGINVSFSPTDFPMFRLADAYLMYAECVLRGGSPVAGDALEYVNKVRVRSGASVISSNQLTLDFILNERGRELNLEGHRRSDLIRFGKFTGGSYIWPWKGGIAAGTSIPSTYNLFPIPSTALQANPNLKQNPGY